MLRERWISGISGPCEGFDMDTVALLRGPSSKRKDPATPGTVRVLAVPRPEPKLPLRYIAPPKSSETALLSSPPRPLKGEVPLLSFHYEDVLGVRKIVGGEVSDPKAPERVLEIATVLGLFGVACAQNQRGLFRVRPPRSTVFNLSSLDPNAIDHGSRGERVKLPVGLVETCRDVFGFEELTVGRARWLSYRALTDRFGIPRQRILFRNV